MLSDQDIQDIKRAARKSLDGCFGFNNTIDPTRLLDSIAKAISEAIKEYDQIRRS